jgi:uncharacterized protein YbjT (DUF2867 family)
MNGSAPGQIHLAIVGATGMVGGYVLRYALDHPSVGLVTVIGRRRLGISHPKLKEVVHNDFADCSALAKALLDQDAAVFCLGVYTGAVPDAEFHKITVDLYNRVRPRSPRQQPRRGVFIPQRERRGSDGTKPHGLRTI